MIAVRILELIYAIESVSVRIYRSACERTKFKGLLSVNTNKDIATDTGTSVKQTNCSVLAVLSTQCNIRADKGNTEIWDL